MRHGNEPGSLSEGVGAEECAAVQGGVASEAGRVYPERGSAGKVLSPSRRRRGVDHVIDKLAVSEPGLLHSWPAQIDAA